jgi:hypothetical protein
MTYSKTHQNFSQRLNQSDALTDPEKYLGPNWEDVLNFWIYLDTLSNKEKKEMAQSYWALDEEVRNSAWNAARAAAEEVVCREFILEAWRAAYDVTGWRAFGYATCELIVHHKLIEQYKTPLALQYCTKS